MSELQGMEEGRRQAWLAALGIPLWSSRHDLPGALPADPLAFCPYVDESVVSVAPEVVEPSVPREQVVATPLQAAPRTEPQRPERLPEASTARPDISGTAAFPRFSCRIQLLAPGWLGVIALDDVPDLSAQEHRLLGNLVQALGGDDLADAAREHFRWPLSPNPAIPRDADSAREALAAFLGRRREATRWLVLGETMAVYVRAALPQHMVVAAPHLRELLGSSAAKRALWLSLHG